MGPSVSDSAGDILSQARLNEILAALPPADLESIAPQLIPIDFSVDAPFFRQQDRIDDVYFPTSGIISMLTLLEDGTSVEVAVIGSEGMVGIPIVMGAQIETHEALTQSAGTALKIRASDILEQFNQKPAVRNGILRYTHNFLLQVSQNAACNSAHTVEQRLARWLLLTHDRLKTDQFIFTQEFMSRMLSVRRAGVSVAANTLRHGGIIDYSRGSITIKDRKGLEATACECYRTIEAHSL